MSASQSHVWLGFGPLFSAATLNEAQQCRPDTAHRTPTGCLPKATLGTEYQTSPAFVSLQAFCWLQPFKDTSVRLSLGPANLDSSSESTSRTTVFGRVTPVPGRQYIPSTY